MSQANEMSSTFVTNQSTAQTRLWRVGLHPSERPESRAWHRPIRDIVPAGAELQRQGYRKLKRHQSPVHLSQGKLQSKSFSQCPKKHPEFQTRYGTNTRKQSSPSTRQLHYPKPWNIWLGNMVFEPRTEFIITSIILDSDSSV